MTTIRLLPEGKPWIVAKLTEQGSVLRVELGQQPGELPAFRTLDCLEVVTASKIFMGPVLSCSGLIMTVDIEHVLDRERLHTLQALWGLDAE